MRLPQSAPIPSIRLLQPGDAGRYRDLKLRALREDPFSFSDSVEDYLLADPAGASVEIRCLGDPPETFALGLCDAGDVLIGFLRFRRDSRSKAIHKASIHDMYVVPERRGKGLGRVLLDDAIARARRMAGLECVHLWVLHSGASSASGFYRTFGFESQGLVKKDLVVENTYINAEYMVLRLH